MTPSDPLDSRLDSASSELRSQLGDAPIPNFEPRTPIAGPVAAIVAVLLVIGVIGFTQLRSNPSELEVTNNPEQNDLVTPDENVAPDDGVTPIPDDESPSGRASDSLTTAPADVILTTGKDATPPETDRSRPNLGQSLNDAAYDSVVTRVTDAGGRFNRVENNRRQVINANNTLILSHIDDGSREVMAVTSLDSLSLLTELDVRDDAEVVWHPTNPDLVRHLRGGDASNGSLQLFETNVQTGQSTIVADLTDRIVELSPTATHIRNGYGAPSADGNVWTWIVRDGNEKPIGVVTYDLAADAVLGFLSDLDPTDDGRNFDLVSNEAMAEGPTELYSVSTSPTGTYAVLEYRELTVIHDVAFDDYRPVPNLGDSSGLALQTSGTDAYVYIDFNALSTDAGFLVSVDLETFERTRLFDVFDDANTSVQVSGASFDAPGWVVVSTYSCKSDGAWTCDKVMVVELGGQGRIIPLAHTYSCAESFFAEPIATTNRDLSLIYFNSDGGSCTEATEIYEILVPSPLQAMVIER